MAFLNTTLLANPITWVVAGITALVAVFIYLWNTCEPFKQFFIDLWDGIKQAFSSAYEFIKPIIQKLANYFKKRFEMIQEIVSEVIAFVKALFEGDFSKLPQIAKKILEKLREFFSSIFGKIIEKVKTWGSDIIKKVKKSVSDMVSGAVKFAKELPSKIWNAIVGAVQKVGQWGSQMLSKAKTAVSQVVSGVVNGFKNLPSKVMEVGKNLVQGLWNGISDATDWLMDKIGGFGESVLDGICDFFGINSPSRLFRDEVGKYLAEGIGVGLEENSDAPVGAIESLNDDMMNATQGINGITLSRQLNHTFSGSMDGGSIGDLVALVSEYMPKIIEASSRSIVLDDDTLVGKTINKIDEKLATNMRMKARGI